MSRQLNDTDFPCVLIVSGEPSAFNQAVLDVPLHVQVDFVYHMKTITDGATDSAQYIRGRLNVLRQNLLRDFHLKVANGSYLVQNTEVAADPLNKTTSYQTVFAADNMSISAMVLSMRFTLVTSTLGI